MQPQQWQQWWPFIGGPALPLAIPAYAQGPGDPHSMPSLAVMYVGKLVEVAETDALFRRPRHPYTEALLSAIHSPDPRRETQRQRIVLEGDVADPAHPPAGCYFHPRCRYAVARCRAEEPALQDAGDGRLVACHLAAELDLIGAAQ